MALPAPNGVPWMTFGFESKPPPFPSEGYLKLHDWEAHPTDPRSSDRYVNTEETAVVIHTKSGNNTVVRKGRCGITIEYLKLVQVGTDDKGNPRFHIEAPIKCHRSQTIPDLTLRTLQLALTTSSSYPVLEEQKVDLRVGKEDPSQIAEFTRVRFPFSVEWARRWGEVKSVHLSFTYSA